MAEETRKVAFICSKGNLDMAYPALVMGWAALGNGIDVTIFFTFWGMDMINKARVDHLEVPPVANASMKMNMMGVPGYIGIPQWAGIIPGMTPFATALDELEDERPGRAERARIPGDDGRRRREAVCLQNVGRHVRLEERGFYPWRD